MSRRPDHPGSSKHPKKLEPSQPSLVGYCNSFIPKLREDEQILRKREVEDTTRHFDYIQYVNRRFTRIFQLVTFLRSVSASDRWARMRRLGWMVGIFQWVGEVLKCCWGDDLQLQRERYRFHWFPNGTLRETNMKPPKIGLFITPKGHASPPTFDLIRGESYMLVSGRFFFMGGPGKMTTLSRHMMANYPALFLAHRWGDGEWRMHGMLPCVFLLLIVVNPPRISNMTGQKISTIWVDVSPSSIRTGDFPASHGSFQGCYSFGIYIGEKQLHFLFQSSTSRASRMNPIPIHDVSDQLSNCSWWPWN